MDSSPPKAPLKPTPSTTTPAQTENDTKHPLLEILLTEGGISLLFIFPIVVIFFLLAAIPDFH